jgi:hypothetical protein
MRRWSPVVLTPIIAAASACISLPMSVPEPVSPVTSVQYYDLDIPSDLEIKTVDFGATPYTYVNGINGSTSSTTSVETFVKVYAVQRQTGEQFMLVYEDIARRKRPTQVIHFRPAPDVISPGT